MIKARKIGLILEKDVLIDSILKNDIVIRVCCEFLSSDYDRLYLKYPEDKEHLAQYFYDGKTIEVSLNTMNGRVTYPAKILYEPCDNLIVVEYYKTKQFFEKRKSFRVNVTKMVKIITNNNELIALTLNISSGGFKLIMNDELDEKNKYLGYLHLLQNSDPIRLNFFVHSVRFLATEKKYEVSGEFIDLPEAHRKILTKFCFDVQTALLNEHNHIS